MKIRDMRKALDSKEISAKELAQTYFERIKKYDDKVKSFITVTEEKALEQAEKAQGVIDKGEAKALTGIPVAVKDNICTEGVKTTCCVKKCLKTLFRLIMRPLMESSTLRIS